jgi:hypothetical protein
MLPMPPLLPMALGDQLPVQLVRRQRRIAKVIIHGDGIGVVGVRPYTSRECRRVSGDYESQMAYNVLYSVKNICNGTPRRSAAAMVIFNCRRKQCALASTLES